MKPLKILVFLSIVLLFALECTKAQIPPAVSFQTQNKISPLQPGNLSTSRGLPNTYQINYQFIGIPVLTDLTKDSGFISNAAGINFYDFINTEILLKWSKTRMPLEMAAKKNYGTTITFKIQWESLKRIPFIDPAIAYYCPFKKTDELTLCNCHLYRTAAFIIPRMLQFRYPGAHSTSIYPPAYLQPNYSTEERSK